MKSRTEVCAGIIPVRISPSGALDVLLVTQTNTIRCFPKGHVEAIRGGGCETLFAAAARELHEETGLDVHEWLDAPREGFVYDFRFVSVPKHPVQRIQSVQRTAVHKVVHLFPALVAGSLALRPREIASAAWMPLEDASNALASQPQLQAVLELARRSANRHIARGLFLNKQKQALEKPSS